MPCGDIVKSCGLSGLRQLVQQRLRVHQILRVEAFREPVVDGGEEGAGFVLLALALPEPGEARRRASPAALRSFALDFPEDGDRPDVPAVPVLEGERGPIDHALDPIESLDEEAPI